MRYFFYISYLGKNYHGWQSQRNALSVQQVLEERLSTFFRKPIKIVGSGRTDAGVHARKQVFHADMESLNEPQTIRKLNAFLPEDIAVFAIRRVKEDAHARFGALSRGYDYQIVLHKDPFEFESSHRVRGQLDLALMNEAASLYLIGENDFTSFSRVKTDVEHFRCKITRAFWSQRGDHILFEIDANRFLRGMVRAIVGTLLNIGTGSKPVDHIGRVIEAKDRREAGQAVPSKGLYLSRISYPKGIFID